MDQRLFRAHLEWNIIKFKRLHTQRWGVTIFSDENDVLLGRKKQSGEKQLDGTVSSIIIPFIL